MLAGTAVAANSIASEREGRTWEALQLTGLPPRVIARGKFWAAYTAVGLYIVMMAPVGAVPFLFGGVTALETALAFVLLFVVAAVSVAFGLAVSSKMESLRGAILVTVLVALMVTPTLFSMMWGASSVAHDAWPLVAEGPIWLPTAYVRAPFDARYFVALVLAPVMAVGLTMWFLREATLASLTSVTDDRSTGLRRWFVATTASLAAVATVGELSLVQAPGASLNDALVIAMFSLAGFFLVLTFMAFVAAGEPIGPSRRVQRGWVERGTGPVGRALGPGVMRAAGAQLLAGLGGVALIAVSSALTLRMKTGSREVLAVLLVAFYGACFHVFVVGFGSWLRARTGTAMTTRLVLLVGLFLASVGPWILAALGGSLGHGSSLRDTLIAAPSPFYVVVVSSELTDLSRDPTPVMIVCAAVAGAWALLGLGLLGGASLRCQRVIREHEKALAEGEAFLRAEDEAAQAPVA